MPSTNATAQGRATTAMSVRMGERNGSHQTGTPSELIRAMKSGTPPGPASASLRCMAMR
jgi:hypothetical protein